MVVAATDGAGAGFAIGARLGANVIVTEIDPTKAIEAVMDGFPVMSMLEAAEIGDLFVTLTGGKSVVGAPAFRAQEERHDRVQLRPLQCRDRPRSAGRGFSASSRHQVREYVEEFALRDGPRVYVLGEGRLITPDLGEGPSPPR